MKRVATPSNPDVAVPVAVIAVHVDFVLCAVVVEVGIAMYEMPSISLPI